MLDVDDGMTDADREWVRSAEEDWRTVGAVAEWLGVSREAVDQWCARGCPHAWTRGRRRERVFQLAKVLRWRCFVDRQRD